MDKNRKKMREAFKIIMEIRRKFRHKIRLLKTNAGIDLIQLNKDKLY